MRKIFKIAFHNKAIICTLICVVIAVLCGSRAFMLGYAIGLYSLIASKGWLTKSYNIWILVILTSLLIVLISVKYDSSLGRLLVYKITFLMFKDHWLNGIGLGSFKLNYLHYQEAYFKTGNFTQKELLLADNTQHAFNDYWQFILETGVKGIIIIIVCLLLIITLIVKAIKNNPDKPNILLFAVVQMLAIGIAALFTHVFERFIIQFVFIVSFFVVIVYQNLKNFKQVISFAVLCLLLLSYIHYGFYLRNYRNYKKFKEAQSLFKAGYITESVTNHRQLFASLKDDPFYLLGYAQVLSAYGDDIEAETLLKLVLTKQSNSQYYYQLAHCYHKNGKLKNAEAAYLTAIYMVPNRFIPRYNLYLFYKNTGQPMKAIKTANDILALPVKIPSVSIDNIKNEIVIDKY